MRTVGDPATSTPMRALHALISDRSRADEVTVQTALGALGPVLRKEVADFCRLPQVCSGTSPPEHDAQEAQLVQAVRRGDLQWASHLLRFGADPDVCDEIGETPLFEAVAQGRTDLVATLLLARADCWLQSPLGQTPLAMAPAGPVNALMQLFAGEGWVLEPASLDMALCGLTEQLRIEVARHLGLKDQLFALGDQDAPLAVEASDGQEVEAVADGALERRLVQAVACGEVEEVKWCLERGANPNAEDLVGDPVLFEAVLSNNPELVAALLVYRADPGISSSGGPTPADIAEDVTITTLLQLFLGHQDVDMQEKHAAMRVLSEDLCHAVMLHLGEGSRGRPGQGRALQR